MTVLLTAATITTISPNQLLAGWGENPISTQPSIDPGWWDTERHGGRPIRQFLADRDIEALFQFLHRRGWSWSAIARATDLGDQRVREIASGKRKVVNYEVFLRIATGLGIPKGYLGLGLDRPSSPASTPGSRPISTSEFVGAASDRAISAPDPVIVAPEASMQFARWEATDQVKRLSVAAALQSRDINVTGWGPARLQAPIGAGAVQLPTDVGDFDAADLPPDAKRIGEKLAALAQVLDLSPTETVQLAGLAGNVVELDLRIEVRIDGDGNSQLVFTHDVFNMSGEPLTRVARQLWFEHAARSGLRIEPFRRDHRQIAIDRTHNAGPTMAKFSCQVSPAIQPGETGVISYTCAGGQFLDAFYWRQDILRYTRRFTIALRQVGGHRLITCTGEQVQPNGLINSATEDLLWDYDGDDIVVTLTREYLRPNESVTLRWEFDRDQATA